ncbi:hypothetical protein C8J57DRAFT_1475780 [Mycena rebaudengoi]|nr:hypothetical protein C8J57DRAFT_1475780 [Mycena rebaudengoi]
MAFASAPRRLSWARPQEKSASALREYIGEGTQQTQRLPRDPCAQGSPRPAAYAPTSPIRISLNRKRHNGGAAGVEEYRRPTRGRREPHPLPTLVEAYCGDDGTSVGGGDGRGREQAHDTQPVNVLQMAANGAAPRGATSDGRTSGARKWKARVSRVRGRGVKELVRLLSGGEGRCRGRTGRRRRREGEVPKIRTGGRNKAAAHASAPLRHPAEGEARPAALVMLPRRWGRGIPRGEPRKTPAEATRRRWNPRARMPLPPAAAALRPAQDEDVEGVHEIVAADGVSETGAKIEQRGRNRQLSTRRCGPYCCSRRSRCWRNGSTAGTSAG